MSELSDFDSLDDALGGPSPAPAAAFQDEVWRKTVKVVCRRRWARRGGMVIALAACYAGGIWSAPWFFRKANMGPVEQVRAVDERPAVESTSPREAASGVVDESPLALEWRALDSLGKRPDLYRQAGDRYLAEGGDVQSALRCYRILLDTDAHEAAAISPNDSWLLMALKEEKQKEKERGKNNNG